MRALKENKLFNLNGESRESYLALLSAGLVSRPGLTLEDRGRIYPGRRRLQRRPAPSIFGLQNMIFRHPEVFS